MTQKRKLVDLARDTIKLLIESGDDGIRSDVIAKRLNTPKRRVYDVIAVLKAMDLVKTRRRFDGTTITWIDRMKDFVPKSEYDTLSAKLEEVLNARNELQIQVAELKEQIRITKSKIRRDSQVVESSTKTEFNTTMLTIRALSSRGFKSVRDSGLEVVIETYEPGMTADPTVIEQDETSALIKSLQRL